MESRNAAETITALLRQLITVHDPSVVGITKRKVLLGEVSPSSVSKDILPKMYPYCLGILSSHLQPSHSHNATHLSELVKRRFTRDGRTSQAIQFSELFSKLMLSDQISAKWETLYVLYSLWNSGETKTRTTIPANGLILSKSPASDEKDIQESKDEDISSKRQWERAIEGLEIRDDKESTLLLGSREGYEQYQKEFAPKMFSVAEIELLQDLMYVLQGIEGKYIKMHVEQEDSFVLDSKVSVPQATRDMIHSIAEVGWLYRKVKSFTENKLRRRAGLKACGLMMQSFCAALQEELNEYYRLVAVLDGQVNAQKKAVGVSPQDMISLRRLLVWTVEPLERLKILSILVDTCSEMHGGALITALHRYAHHGDPQVSSCVGGILKKVSQPLYRMVSRWIFEGDLEDPFDEFFVRQDVDASAEEMWTLRYQIRPQMLPSFVSKELAQRILIIGKSVIFIRESCGDREWVLDEKSIREAQEQFDQLDPIKLEIATKEVDRMTNSHMLELLQEKYHMSMHLDGLKRYLLLGQGDFLQYLLELVGPELDRPHDRVMRHNILGILESAIRGSNSQFDNPEVLECLDVSLAKGTPGEDGWDIFSLDYRVGMPLSTLFTKEVMNKYLRVFRAHWRLKRVESRLNSMWKIHMNVSHAVKTPRDDDIVRLLQECYMIRHEMTHFVTNFQYHLMFEVMECAWSELQDSLEKAQNLDEIIAAQNAFLKRLIEDSLLGEEQEKVYEKVRKLLLFMLKFLEQQENIFRDIHQEITRRNMQERVESGAGGVPEWSSVSGSQKMEVSKEVVDALSGSRTEYRAILQNLLKIIRSQKNAENLKYLVFRLDFNEHYGEQ